MTPSEYCRDKVLQSRSSFFYPLLLLQPDKREAMFAVYAFCREVDDIADGPLRQEEAETKLAWWRTEVDALFQGHPQHPVTVALLKARERYDLPQEPFLEMIDGQEMDLHHRPFPTLADLEGYANRVAVTVGRLTMRIFGGEREASDRFSHHLGLAFQFTNILRDVAEDARRQRVYVPLELLEEQGITPEEILAGEWPGGMEKALAPLADTAERHYRLARENANGQDRTAFISPLVMAGVYEAYLDHLKAVRFDVVHHPIRFSAPKKIWLCWKAWRREKRRPYPLAG